MTFHEKNFEEKFLVPQDPPGVPGVPISGPHHGIFSKLDGPGSLGSRVTPIPVSALVDFTANNRHSDPMCRGVVYFYPFDISTRNLIFFHPNLHLFIFSTSLFKSSSKCMFSKADQYLSIHAWPCIQQALSIHTGCSCFSHSTKQTINAGQYLITIHFLKSLKHPLPFLFSQYKSCESETQFGIQFGTFPLLTSTR